MALFGSLAELALICLALPAAAAPGNEATTLLNVWLRTDAAGLSAEGIDVRARPLEAARTMSEVAELRARSDATGRARLELPIQAAWQLECVSTSVWCPGVTIPSDERVGSVEMELHPGTWIRGSLRDTTTKTGIVTPVENGPPAKLLIEGWIDRGEAQASLHFREQVAVRDGRFELWGPAVSLDLRVSAEGWSPVYFWAQPADRSPEGLRLPAIRLVRGASVSGLMLSELNGRPIAGVELHLASLRSADSGSLQEARRQDRQTRETRSDEQGFFQLTGVPAGNYQLSARSGDELHAPRTFAPIEVAKQTETWLDELSLGGYLQVDLQLTPPLAPDGSPWTVQLISPNGQEALLVDSLEITSAPPSAATRAPDPSLSESSQKSAPPPQTGTRTVPVSFRTLPGKHMLTVLGPEGQRAAFHEFDVEADMQLPLDVNLLRLKGRIRLGDAAWQGSLRLSSRNGGTLELASDEDGRFAGWIQPPVQGRITVVAKASGKKLRREMLLTGLEPTDGVLELDLQLGRGEVRGLVHDEEGIGVANALVTARGDSGWRAQVRSDGDGRFRLRALEPEALTIIAGHLDYRGSETVQLKLSPGATPDVQLMLHHGESRSGRLLTADGRPVSGATVISVVPLPAAIDGDRTDLQGRFQLRLPVTARRAVIQVHAPAHASWSGCVELDSEGPLKIHLPPLPGGEVTIDLMANASGNSASPGASHVLWTGSGGYISGEDLFNWALRGSGHTPVTDPDTGFLAEIRTPRLGADLYAAELSALPWWALAARACGGQGSVAGTWQALSNGGHLRLVPGLPGE